MTTELRGAQRVWGGSRDDQGYRTYRIKWLVYASSKNDGPATVLATPGLPLPGSLWAFGNDLDIWCWCRPETEVSLHEHQEGEPHHWWTVEQVFSNKPQSLTGGTDAQRCHDLQIEDPLLEPPRVSGGFKHYQDEAQIDKDGLQIHNSAWEQIKGNIVEFDAGRPTVTIEQNVATQLEAVSLPAQYMHNVNDAPLWGLPTRTIKLSDASWSKEYYGQCTIYYKRTLIFDVMYETFDRTALDEGTKVLNGHWGSGQGSGATVFINAVDGSGAITAIAMGAGGTGYEKNCTIGLKVKQVNGTGGIVLAKTNANGVVTAMTLYRGGRNYFAAPVVAVDTVVGFGWVLDHLKQGDPPALDTPDRNNPAHFKRFTDRDGNPATVILDGRGIPIGGFTGDETDIGQIPIQKYTAANLLLLGIPTIL